MITENTKELRSVLQKLRMVRWVGCIRLKLIFSNGKIICKLSKVWFFFQWRQPWSLENFRLAKFLTPIKTEFGKFFEGYVHIFQVYSRSDYLYGVNQKLSLINASIFSKVIVLFKMEKIRSNTPLLSKSLLTYLV